MFNMQNTSQNQDNFNQTGKRMMTIAWIIALALLTWIFGNWEENQFNPNQNPEYSSTEQVNEVKLDRNRYGHYLANGYINDQKVTFFVDTGATAVAVPGNLQYKLGLEAGQAHWVSTANGNAKAYATLIDKLVIGNIELTNIRASINPSMEGEEILLGMTVLKHLEFTQKGDELTLRQYN